MLQYISDTVLSFFSTNQNVTAPKTPTITPPDQQTIADLAAMSYQVYRNDDAVVPAGWEWQENLDYQGEKDSFFSACFIKSGPQPVLVFAVRGTVVSETWDLVNDLELYLNEVPSLVTEARKYFDSVFEQLKTNPQYKDQIDTMPVYFTGHSLGAAIAEIAYATYGDKKGQYKTCVYEQPGVEKAVADLIGKTYQGDDLQAYLDQLAVNVFNFQAHVDAITSNTQWGNTYELANLPYTYIVAGQPEPTIDFWHEYIFNPFFLKTYTFNQHNLRNMHAYLSDFTNPTTYVENHDASIELNYLDYLTYDKHKAYWDGYFLVAWQIDTEIQKKFKADFNSFKDDALKQLADAQNWWEVRCNFVVIPSEAKPTVVSDETTLSMRMSR